MLPVHETPFPRQVLTAPQLRGRHHATCAPASGSWLPQPDPKHDRRLLIPRVSAVPRWSVAALAASQACWCRSKASQRPRCTSSGKHERTIRRASLQEVSEDRKQELQSLAVTLLSRLRSRGVLERLEDIGHVDGRTLHEVLGRLNIECSPDDASILFNVIDADGRGSIEIKTLRRRLRDSEAISDMYKAGFTGVLLTLIPTVAVGLGFAILRGPEVCFDFFTGYIIEDSLSVDNLFVFLVLFRSFKVPPTLQPYCLTVGIIGAILFRSIFIFAGLAAVEAFRPILLLFSGLLITSALSSFTASEDEDDEDPGPPAFLKGVLDKLPMTPSFEGTELIVQNPETGAWLATPLLLCIISIELSDIIFAVDSVPAVFAVTQDPFVVFSSNIGAILGLRSLYQVLAISIQDLIYLEQGVAVVLLFIGLKLAAEVFGYQVSSAVTLAFIAFILSAAVFLSLREQQKEEENASL